jgi:hypothetical protein
MPTISAFYEAAECMYWDVVEVVPDPNYSLWVRFKDGLSGRVRLEPEEFTGVLAPLRDTQFLTGCISIAAR